MIKILFEAFQKRKIELFIFTLLNVLFIIRTVNSFFKYPFILIYVVFVIYILVYYKFQIFKISKKYLYYIIIILLLFIYFIISCLLSDKIYLVIIKDIINIFVLLTLMHAFELIIKDKNDLKLFFNYFIQIIIFSSLIVSFIQINNYFYNSTYENSDLFNTITFGIDNNFALLPVIIGMLGIFFLFLNEITTSQKIVYNLFLFIFSINSIISGSKRGIFIFTCIYLSLFLFQVLGLFNKKIRKKLLVKNSVYYVLSFILFLLLSYGITISTSVYTKNEILRRIGIRNIAFTKIQITETLYRYIHIVDKNISDDYLYQKIWNPIFDPKDPDSGWANRGYKIVENLVGKNVEIVPSGTKGYLFDSSCTSETSGHHAYYFNLIKHDTINKGDSIVTSIYCFVSEDFNGDGAAIRADCSSINSKDKWYDLKNRGSWQKLELSFSCSNGNVYLYLYINKAEVTNFSTLKGYVIFAYPEYNVISKDTLYKDTRQNNLLNGNISEHSKEKNNSSHYSINIYSPSNLLCYGCFISTPINNFITLFTRFNLAKDPDPIRKWIAKIVSEDTTYFGFKSKFNSNSKVLKFGDDRYLRWKFAIEIFIKEYSWSQKIFGNGFNFLNWYGYYFSKNKNSSSDYPHNPFLYILLYSGIIGVLLYCFLLYKVFYYYIKYIKEYYLFFIFFLITYFFTFFSGGNPFDPPIMGFFMMLPFFIHYIHEKDKEVKDKVESGKDNGGLSLKDKV